MAKIDDLKNRTGETIYPRTLTKAVHETSSNKQLDVVLADMATAIGKKMNNTKITISNLEADVNKMNEGDIWIKYE